MFFRLTTDPSVTVQSSVYMYDMSPSETRRPETEHPDVRIRNRVVKQS